MVVVLPYGECLVVFCTMRSCHIEGSIHKPDFRTDFWVEKKGNLVVSPLINCSHVNELDVRLLNFSIRSSVA